MFLLLTTLLFFFTFTFLIYFGISLGLRFRMFLSPTHLWGCADGSVMEALVLAIFFIVPSIVTPITFLIFSIVLNLPPVRIEIELVRLLMKIFFSELLMIKCWNSSWTESTRSLIVSSMTAVLFSPLFCRSFLRCSSEFLPSSSITLSSTSAFRTLIRAASSSKPASIVSIFSSVLFHCEHSVCRNILNFYI